ncbi:patellin-3-like [Musa acuminata AAA Group]|uniref:patellin-3-like n=1 Tax=Musa acuminata AAA Group TaxID=214697 RepID=UPI0031D6F3D6
MAEVSQSKAAAVAATEEVMVGKVALTPTDEVVKQLDVVPAPEVVKGPKKVALLSALAAEAAAEAEEKRACGAEKEAAEKAASVFQAISFKEESSLVADLEDHEKKALDEMKQLVRAALASREFSSAPPPPAAPLAKEAKLEEPPASTLVEAPPKPATETPAPPSRQAEADEAPEQQSAADKNTVTANEDGAKTLEAIEETVVSVAATPPPEEAMTPVAAEEEAEKTDAAAAASAAKEVLIWGIPLLVDERSDTVLIKFLRARDFKAKEAMAMLKNAVLWREEFGIEALLSEDLGVPELERAVFMHGADRAGHPVCYNVYGELQSKELYALAFADEKKKKRFLRWRIQFLEKGIRNLLDFTPGGISTMVQVADLKNSTGPAKELRHAFALLQDNYPEFVAKQIFINVPWWYLAFNRMMSPFFTQRTRSKFVFARPSNTAETLSKYIAPEQVPVRYGGLSKENDPDFTSSDAVTEITIKPSMRQAIEIQVTEKCLLVWELRVLGWEVTYGAEFVPRSENGYTVIVQKERKLVAADEPVLKGSFKIGEAGKIVLTVHNSGSKRKKLLYRYKIKSSAEST